MGRRSRMRDGMRGWRLTPTLAGRRTSVASAWHDRHDGDPRQKDEQESAMATPHGHDMQGGICQVGICQVGIFQTWDLSG